MHVRVTSDAWTLQTTSHRCIWKTKESGTGNEHSTVTSTHSIISNNQKRPLMSLKKCYHRQPGRQGLAVLMASAVVVLEHETSNFNPSPKAQFYINWSQIGRGWLRYGGYQPCQIWFGSDERTRCHVGSTYTGLVTSFFLAFFYSSTELQPIPVNQFSRTIAQRRVLV